MSQNTDTIQVSQVKPISGTIYIFNKSVLGPPYIAPCLPNLFGDFHIEGYGLPLSVLSGNGNGMGFVPTDVFSVYTKNYIDKLAKTFTGPPNSWNLTGNSGTTSSTNFIGTTDDIPLRFRVHGDWAGQIQSNIQSFANTSFGYFAGGRIISTVITTPNHEFYQGIENSAFGSTALLANTIGNNNTAIGSAALSGNATGSGNTAIGQNSMVYYANGSDNTAIGSGSLYGLLNYPLSGSQNVAIGVSSLQSNTSGSMNVSIGTNNMLKNVNGSQNIAIGTGSFNTNISGTNNTIIGNQADVGQDQLTNATAIGNGAIVNASNQIVIGNNSITQIGGSVAWQILSDERFKLNIRENVPGIEFIKNLKAVTYQVNIDKLDQFTKTGVLTDINHHVAYHPAEQIVHSGFLAQQVEQICKDLGYDFDAVVTPSDKNGHYSLAYSQFVVPLVKAVQEQEAIIESQKEENKILKDQIAEILKRLDKIEKNTK